MNSQSDSFLDVCAAGCCFQEFLRHGLMTEHEFALKKLQQETEDQLYRAQREIEELQDELRNLQHNRDQSLLQAETEKQQVCSRDVEFI